jgi:predicted outer membrane repeat protein
MHKIFPAINIFCFFLSACQAVSGSPTGSDKPSPKLDQVQAETISKPSSFEKSSTLTTSDITNTPVMVPSVQPTETDTPATGGLIKVDTLDQEVYPFIENQKCSLGEAIIAANQQKQVDTCPAGGTDQSVIELIPGTYLLPKIDATPQQVEWAYSTTGTGNAFPAIVRPLTMIGNGAVLSREGAREPFRIFEVIFGTFTLKNATLTGGEVKEKDWGGAILVENASLVLDGVTVKDSKAENGGGVYLSNGGLTIRNSTFSGNSALSFGGGLYGGQTKAEIRSSKFIDNKSDGYGAGVYVSDVFITVTESSFIGNRSGSRGGGINLEVANAKILRSQFYKNYADISGAGISGRNYLYAKDIADAEADPFEKMIQSDTYVQMATQIPGFRQTLEAQPSGMYIQRKLDIQVHDSCFLGNANKSTDPADTSTAIAGRTSSENNYFGDPSGPGGMGEGKGETIGREVAFEPFLKTPPSYCDLSQAAK